MFLMKRLLLILLCAATPAVTGCGESDVRKVQLAGSVTFNGEPVPYGTITFSPAGGNSGPQGRADIVNGEYDTSKDRGKGVVGGAYHVTITGLASESDPTSDETPKALFPTYKTEATMPTKSETIDFTVK